MKHKIYTDDEGLRIIERKVWPRYRGVITFGQDSDIEHIEWIDKVTDPLVIARVLREAGDDIAKDRIRLLEVKNRYEQRRYSAYYEAFRSVNTTFGIAALVVFFFGGTIALGIANTIIIAGWSCHELNRALLIAVVAIPIVLWFWVGWLEKKCEREIRAADEQRRVSLEKEGVVRKGGLVREVNWRTTS